MTEERQSEKPKIESLELNRETLTDLTEADAEQVGGGFIARGAKDINWSGTQVGVVNSCPNAC
jgi:hypothetical protein